MAKNKISTFSIIVFVVSLFPLLTLITLSPQITLTGSVQRLWAAGNIACAVFAFVFSIVQVKNSSKASLVKFPLKIHLAMPSKLVQAAAKLR